jgi:hypothetical protein
MKKLFVILLSVISIALFGCEKDDSGTEAGNEIKGSKFENEFFSIIVASGYTKMNIDGGIQIYKGYDIIEVSFRGTNMAENEAEIGANSLAKSYKGTTPEKTQLLGLWFYKTTIEINNTTQTVWLAIKNGKKINISITGKNHETNADLQGMFKTIVLK